MAWPQDRTCAVCRAIHAAYGFMRRSAGGALERVVVCPGHIGEGRAWHEEAGAPSPWRQPASPPTPIAPALIASTQRAPRLGEQGSLL